MPSRSEVAVVGAGEFLRLASVRLAAGHVRRRRRRRGRRTESQLSW
jgi:hypothetical protein